MTEKQLLVSRVKALAEALDGSEVAELDLTENGMRIVLRRRMEPVVVLAASVRAGRPRRGASARASAPAPEPGVAVIAPLTGVFYSRPSPGSEPFVQAGDTVQAGQVVCIVEAMKVFNEIKSEVSGTVSAMVPTEGQLVQKGDALLRVKAV
ncbi:MAG: acetyl-CoA carboxylase biotin carboxyl carrier protein [Ktedonobacterales bacterium]